MEIGTIKNQVVEIANNQTSSRLIVEKKKLEKDSVSISEDAKVKLAELTEKAKEVQNDSAELSLKQLTVKNRIENGYYDTPEFNQKLAELLTDKFLDESI